MKRRKIAGINFEIEETKKGLFFQFDSKDDIKVGLKLGSNKVVKEIQSLLDDRFGKGQFFYKSGRPLEEGLQFNYTPSKLIDKL